MAGKKRFYKDVAVASVDGTWRVHLDGRDVYSPAGTILSLPNPTMAEAVAGEWAVQEDEISPTSMPLFSLAVTVIDRVTPQRPALIDELAAYGGNDLLCYRDNLDDLAAHQAQHWQPWLDWLESTYGITLVTVNGIMPVTQNEVKKFPPLLAGLNDWRLGMLHRATSLTGSLVLGLGFVTGRIGSDYLFDLAFLDELWQSRKWGIDFEAAERQDRIRQELVDVASFLSLLPAE